MNNAFEALRHVQKAISLLGEDLVTLTAHHGIDALPAVALGDELLKLHEVVAQLAVLPP
jgi:hypothetical protein